MSEDHDHDDHDHSELSEIALRVRALETLLVEKGYVDPAALDALVESYETKIGPRNGARVVARAWSDPDYRARLFDNATRAVAELGYSGRQGEHLVALENTPERHNLVVCTLCSCYPWSVLGLPPVWYKAPSYRSRAVIDPRGVLAEFGVELPADKQIRVWDSTAEMRYLVIPERPKGSEGWSERRLAALVTRDSMIGVGLALAPGGGIVNGAQDLGGMMGFGPIEIEPDEPVFHHAWEKRALAVTLAANACGLWNLDMNRHARETLPPAAYLSKSYYDIWISGLEKMLLRTGMADEAELRAGKAMRPARPVPGRLVGENVARVLAAGTPYDRPAPSPAAFAVGDTVRTQVINPTTHTRLPRYARGKTGTIESVRGCFVFPDSNAHGLGEDPRWLYTVRFSGANLWGAEADPKLTVSIDAWEPYLDRA